MIIVYKQPFSVGRACSVHFSHPYFPRQSKLPSFSLTSRATLLILFNLMTVKIFFYFLLVYDKIYCNYSNKDYLSLGPRSRPSPCCGILDKLFKVGFEML